MPDFPGVRATPTGATNGEILNQFISHDRLFDEIEAVLNTAHLLFRASLSAKANHILEIAVLLFKQLPEGPRKDHFAAHFSALFGMTLSAENRQAESAEQFAKSAQLYSNLDDKAGLYYSTLAEGIRLRDSGCAVEALALFRRAEALDRTHHVELDSSRKYALQIDIVGALIQMECTSEIVRQISECLCWIPCSPCRELAGLLLQQGNYSTFFGDYKEALAAYKHGVETAEDIHDGDMKAHLLRSSALCYRMQAEQTGDAATMHRSADYRRLALQAYAEVGSVKEAMTQYNELVSTLQSLHDDEGARDACLSAVDFASQFGLASDQFRFTAHAGFLSLSLHDYEGALDLYAKASCFSEGSREDHQKVLGELARLHYAKGETDHAIRFLSESCDLLAAIGDRGAEREEREVLAHWFTKLGRAGEADPNLRRLQELSQVSHRVPSGLASTAHPRANADRAAELNIAYIEELKSWKQLSWLKRLRAAKPKRPEGI